MSVLADNRIARHRYEILDNFTAGIVLVGTEVKSAKEGKIQLRDSYVVISGGEAILLNSHIAQYSHGNIQNHEPTRSRKLLLKKKEIEKLESLTQEKGYSVVPLKFFTTRGLIKVEIGVGRGKKLHDKRETIKRRDADREMHRAKKDAVRG